MFPVLSKDYIKLLYCSFFLFASYLLTSLTLGLKVNCEVLSRLESKLDVLSMNECCSEVFCFLFNDDSVSLTIQDKI